MVRKSDVNRDDRGWLERRTVNRDDQVVRKSDVNRDDRGWLERRTVNRDDQVVRKSDVNRDDQVVRTSDCQPRRPGG